MRAGAAVARTRSNLEETCDMGDKGPGSKSKDKKQKKKVAKPAPKTT